jgi:hypothetical protein
MSNRWWDDPRERARREEEERWRHEHERRPERGPAHAWEPEREPEYERGVGDIRWGTGGMPASHERGYRRSIEPTSPPAREPLRRPQGPFVGRGPRGYRRSDERIRDDVCDRFTEHGWLDATDIEVAVTRGEVMLVGLVSSRAAKRLAEDVAESVIGVVEVHNQLRIRREGGEREESARSSGEGGRSPASTGDDGRRLDDVPGR